MIMIQEQYTALPAAFEARMRQMLGDEYDAFEKSMREEDRYRSLRVNSLKTDPGTFAGRDVWELEPVPWEPAGFYYREEDRPGRHPWHEAGMYYIQEPSAMAVSALAGARPGERVLDLCAAPGGKTTGLAAAMEGMGPAGGQ
jgi:16S rRNA C967 or C1407 C5-methylase (RsmB/RsmF family)